MTNQVKEKSIKWSFTIKENIYSKLKINSSKSKIVNEVLTLYFEKNNYLKKAEEKFWNEKIKQGLRDVENWDTIAINPNWEKITDELLNKTLWP